MRSPRSALPRLWYFFGNIIEELTSPYAPLWEILNLCQDVSTVALALLSATSSLLMMTMQRSAVPRSLLRFALSCSIKRRYISHPSHDTSLQLHLCCCSRLATLCTITGLLKMTYRANLSAFALITCWPFYFSMRWILSITFGFGDAALTKYRSVNGAEVSSTCAASLLFIFRCGW